MTDILPNPEVDFEAWRNEFPQYHSYAQIVGLRIGCEVEMVCKAFWGVLQLTIEDGDDPDDPEEIPEISGQEEAAEMSPNHPRKRAA